MKRRHLVPHNNCTFIVIVRCINAEEYWIDILIEIYQIIQKSELKDKGKASCNPNIKMITLQT